MTGILVVGEHFDGLLRDVTLEMIGAAASIKDGLGGTLRPSALRFPCHSPRRVIGKGGGPRCGCHGPSS